MVNIKEKFDRKTTMLLIATLLWMGIIFVFSSQPAEESAALSGKVVEMLEAFIKWMFKGNIPGLVSGIIENSGFVVRKSAHIFEYFVLGVLMISLVRRLKAGRSLVVSLIVCMVYASLDEFHQMFVPGRGPQVTDVAIDTVASFAGMLVKSILGRGDII